MFPVLFSFGNISVSSFGVFLALGFLVGVFLIWRLSRAWDLDEEKILDLTLLTFLGGLVGARIYFVLENLQFFFQNLGGIFLFNKYPGFSFWGAFLGGWLTLYFLSKKKKLDFLQLGDIASVGFLGGLILSNLGCFLGACNVGVRSDLFLAVNMLGFAGERFPVQLLEASLLLWVLLKLWTSATHFHLRGKILSLSLMYIGAIKLLMEPFKETHSEGVFLSFVLLILGITYFYKVTKRNIILDIKGLSLSVLRFFTNSQTRKYAMDRFFKYWYNQKTLIFWKLRNLKKLLRRTNVRFSLKNNKLY